MSLRTPEMVLMDIDGTMVDTVPDLAYSVDEMLSQLGLPQRGEATIRNWVGNGIDVLVHRALTNDHHGKAEDAEFEQAFALFKEIYADNASRNSRFYPGVEEGLAYLKKQSFKLGCVTNKRTRFTEILLKDLGIYDDFAIVICGDTLPKRKPDPMPLLHAADFFQVAPENSLMVGDSTNDVYAGKAAGFMTICVDYGYNCGANIRDCAPDVVVHSLADLPLYI